MQQSPFRTSVRSSSWAALTVAALLALVACAKEAPKGRVEAPDPAPPAPTVSSAPATESTLSHTAITVGGRAEEALPWVVAIHGLGDTPDNFVHLLSDSAIRAHVYAPRAPYPYGDGFDWYQTRVLGDPSALTAAVQKAMSEVVRFVDDRSKDPRNVGKAIVLGFSQGGILSFALATHHPERFRLAIPIGGLLPQPLWPKDTAAGNVPIVALHGTADTVVPIAPTRQLTERLQRLGHPATLLEFEGVGHAIPTEARARLFDLLRSELSR